MNLFRICCVLLFALGILGCGLTGSLQEIRDSKSYLYVDKIEDVPFEQVKGNLKNWQITIGDPKFSITENADGTMVTVIMTNTSLWASARLAFIDFIRNENTTRVVGYNYLGAGWLIDNVIDIAMGRKPPKYF